MRVLAAPCSAVLSAGLCQRGAGSKGERGRAGSLGTCPSHLRATPRDCPAPLGATWQLGLGGMWRAQPSPLWEEGYSEPLPPRGQRGVVASSGAGTDTWQTP